MSKVIFKKYCIPSSIVLPRERTKDLPNYVCLRRGLDGCLMCCGCYVYRSTHYCFQRSYNIFPYFYMSSQRHLDQSYEELILSYTNDINVSIKRFTTKIDFFDICIENQFKNVKHQYYISFQVYAKYWHMKETSYLHISTT